MYINSKTEASRYTT